MNAGFHWPDTREARSLTLVLYGLYALALFMGVTAVVAVIINYIKRDEVGGTWLASHFAWQIRTFWWSLLFAVIGAATTFLWLGYPILLATWIWYIYRIMKGFLYCNDRKAMVVRA